MPHANVSRSAFRADLAAYLKLCTGVNTPRSLTCFILASSGEWEQLLNLAVHFDDQNVEHSALDYLVTSCLKKNPRLPLGVDTAQVAFDKFLECEEHVKRTNMRFRELAIRGWEKDCKVKSHLKKARRWIARILGPLSETDLNYVWDRARFGPGSTRSVSGLDVSASRKYSALGATPRLSPLLEKLLPAVWLEGSGSLYVPRFLASKATTVPKNAKTDRAINTEPHNNVWLQLGIGALMRRKLRKIGLNLDTQADVNRLLAEYAYSWNLATIDLESASDTVAETLVRYLLPARWVHLLELARTEFVEMPDGNLVRLEKWSAMGNGYTFELETLIFYALSLAVTGNPAHTAVFGDDIIVPQADATTLIATLEFCGFRVNRTKTFLGGSFFESCGTDWLRGIDIRPFYFKAEIEGQEDLIDASFKRANQIRRYAHRLCKYGGHHGCDSRFLPAWLAAHAAIPKRWSDHRIPAVGATDDAGLISNFDEASPTFIRKWGLYRFRCRSRSASTGAVTSSHGRLLAFLRTPRYWASDVLETWTLGDYLKVEPSVSFVTGPQGLKRRVNTDPSMIDHRGSKLKGVTAVGHVLQWPSLGPWMQ